MSPQIIPVTDSELELLYGQISGKIDLVNLVPASISFQGKPLDILHRRPMFSPLFQKERKVKKNVYMAGRQIGKALVLDTKIVTPTGWTTMGELKVGDTVMGEDGKPTKVAFVTETMYNHKCYEILFDDGEKVTADADHLWKVSNRKRNVHGNLIPRIVTTEGLIKLMPKTPKGAKYSIACCTPLALPQADLPINPYILGLCLGDGHAYSASICVGGGDLSEFLHQISLRSNSIHKRLSKYKDGNCYRPTIKGIKGSLISLGLIKNKHIPQIYLRASTDQRLELLRGLMDMDGSVSPGGGCEITQKNKTLSIQIRELLSSLGIKSRIREVRRKIREGDVRSYWCVGFATLLNCFSCSRKGDSHKLKIRGNPQNTRHYIVSITEVPSVPVRCIKVDNKDSMFLCGKSMIPTHNTVSISASILMNMWWKEYFRVMYVAPMSIYTQRLHSMFMQPMTQGKLLPWPILDTSCTANVNEKSFMTGSRFIGISCYNNASNALGSTADHVIFDESQDLNADFIPQIREVSGTSDYRYEDYLGTARGIDNTLTKLFENSTQSEWHMTCRCGHENMPTMDGKVLEMIQVKGICCINCGKLIDVDRGQWRRSFEYDPIHRDAEGYHIPQIIVKDRITPHDRYIDTIYNKLHGSNAYSEARFLQEILGIPTSQGGVPITHRDIAAASTLDIAENSFPNMQQYQRVAGGVDWGGAEVVSFTVGTIVGYSNGIFDCTGAIRPTGLPDEQRHYAVGDFLKRASGSRVELVGADAGFVGSVQNPNLASYMSVPVGSIAYGTTKKFFIPNTNNCFTVDRTTLVYIVLTLIKSQRIRFPKGAWFEKFSRDLLAIFTEDATNSHGTTIRRYSRYQDKPDDFLHALGYAVFMAAIGITDLPSMAGMPANLSINAPYISDIGQEVGRFGN